MNGVSNYLFIFAGLIISSPDGKLKEQREGVLLHQGESNFSVNDLIFFSFFTFNLKRSSGLPEAQTTRMDVICASKHGVNQ